MLASQKAMEADYNELEAIFLSATENRTTNINEMTEGELQSIYIELQFLLG